MLKNMLCRYLKAQVRSSKKFLRQGRGGGGMVTNDEATRRPQACFLFLLVI